jgi:transmembrane sensor
LQEVQFLKTLLVKHTNGTLNPDEKVLLFQSLQSGEQEVEWQIILEELLDERTVLDSSYTEESWELIIKNILHSETPALELVHEHTPLRSMKRLRWVAVAASLILALGLGTYFLLSKNSLFPNVVEQKMASKDIAAPKGSKAMIKLANGKTVLLDSINSGKLADQGNIKVLKQVNGEIIYEGQGTEVSYNTLINPRGSNVVSITLQDGSKVWLNSESSIKYPTAFSGKDRKVELTGEAYFEVAHNAAMPFKVDVAGRGEVNVLGTHFNVNAYDDEKSLDVTLIQGSVNISNGIVSSKLKPGQQAQLTKEITILDNVDTDMIVAWKNGYFSFNGASLEEVMRQISRWYDLKVDYTGNISKRKFAGKISRNNNLSIIMEILKESNINYRIVGNIMTITN